MGRGELVGLFGLLSFFLIGCARHACLDIECRFLPLGRSQEQEGDKACKQTCFSDERVPAQGAGTALANVAAETAGKNGNGQKNGNGNGKNGPQHIRDNGFFIEEAFNQEAGVVQHIFNWVNLWHSNGQGRTRDFLSSYTMELPLGSQTHQFSFTTQFLTAYTKPRGEAPDQRGDIGDTNLNYRYQLLASDELLWSAPRFSLVLPTGDERFGLGTGRLGYQFNLPVSKYTDLFDFHFNAGLTYTPDVAAFLAGGVRSPRHDLRTYNLGGSAFWKPQVNFHMFVELFALWMDGINERGFRVSETQLFVNPGFRFAIIQDPVEWVLGVAVPVGLTRHTPDIGVFAYMSVEHDFLKKEKKNGNGE